MTTHTSNPETTVDNIQQDCRVARLTLKYDDKCFNYTTVQFLLDVIKEQEENIRSMSKVPPNNDNWSF